MINRWIERFIKSPELAEQEIYRDTLTEFAWVFMGVGILVIASPSTSSGLSSAAVGLSAAGALLMIAGGFAFWLRQSSIRLAWSILGASLTCAIGIIDWQFPDSTARYFYFVPVMLASLINSRVSLIAASTFSAVVHLIVAANFSKANFENASGPMALIVITAFTSWLAMRQLRASLSNAESFYVSEKDVVTDAQEQRATLARTVKALELSNYQLEKLNIQLDQARKIAEEASRFKTEFLSHMSHELRTPLNAIINFSAFVADGTLGEVNPAQVDAMQKVIDSGNHLLSLINDVLDMSKIEAGMMSLFIEDVNVNAILELVASTGKGLIKDKPVEFIANLPGDLPNIKGDKRRIRQIFLNLVSNAVKFTPQGKVTLRARYDDQHIKISVTDSGIGIAPKDYQLVFDSFKQAQHNLPNIVGTGLGLPICKHLVEAHNGHIWFESTLGSGTTFYVTLPVPQREVHLTY